MLPDGAILGKREADKWVSLKVVIDGVESEAAWSIMAKDVPEFMKEDSQRALSFEVLKRNKEGELL